MMTINQDSRGWDWETTSPINTNSMLMETSELVWIITLAIMAVLTFSLRYLGRGSGGRAIVHDISNTLTLNYAIGDFTGGTFY